MPNTYPVKDKATSMELNRIENKTELPAGIAVLYYGPDDSIPPGWLLLDGRWVFIEDYPALYETFRTGPHMPVPATSEMFKLPILAHYIVKV